MGFFDQAADPYDPDALAALRIQQAIAQSSMPTPYRTPLFSGFGAIAGAKADAAEEAMKNQAARTGQAGANLGLLDQLQQYNFWAPMMGAQPLTIDQLMGLKLGGKQPQGSSETGGQTQSAPYGMPMGAAPMAGTITGEGQTTGNSASPAAAPNSAFVQAMMMKKFGGGATDLQKAQLAAQLLPEGSPERAQAEAYVRKQAGYDNSANVRQGGVLLQYDPASGQMKPSFKNPNLPQGFTINDQEEAVPVTRPGQPSASAAPAAGGIAATNLANNNPGNMKVPGQASQFQKFPDMGSGIGGVANQLHRYGTQGVNTVSSIISKYAPPSDKNDTPAYIADVAKRLGVDPNAPLNMDHPAVISALTTAIIGHEQGNPSLVASPAGQLTQSPLDKASPVQTPVQSGSPNIPSDLGTFEQHAGQNGFQFKTLPDALDTEIAGPVKESGLKDMAASDAERLEKYAAEASGGQKVYTNLQQLYQILGRGLNTGNATETAAHLANYAQQFGMSNLIPKDFDPNDAAAFNKLATDLVFAQLKQIGGRPMVSEIEGLRKANPNVGMPPAANLEVLNNILADQKWKDSRAALGAQFFQKYGYLTPFDSAFNKMYPETDVYNAITNAAAKSGLKLPGSAGTPSGRPSGAAANLKTPPTQADLENTAKKYGMTVDQVKQRLGL